MEIISRSLYEQQIPNIIHEHLDDMKQPQSLDKSETILLFSYTSI